MIDAIELVIIGAGGHGRVVADAAAHAFARERMRFVDDAALDATFPAAVDDIAVLGACAALGDVDAPYVLGIGGDRVARERAGRAATDLGRAALTIVHPAATNARSATLGAGTVVMAGAVINVGAQLGEHVIVNTRAIVEHDVRLDTFTHVAPGAILCGGVTVGRAAHIGAGAVVREGLTIGDGATIGAGAVVIRDVAAGAIVVGNPAKRTGVADTRLARGCRPL